MVSVATQSFATRVAARSLFSFVLAVAVLIVSLAAAAESRASTNDDFATAFLAAPMSESGAVFSAASSPIAVTLPMWDNDYKWFDDHGYVGWDKSIASPNPDGYLLETSYGDTPGLAIGLNGDMEYRPGGATWSYTAPGTTRIATAQMNLSYRNKMFAHHCLGVGLRNGEGNRHLVENCNPPEPDSQASYDVSLADPSSEPTSKEAFFNVRMPICKNPDDTPCSKWIPSLDLIKNGPLARLHKVDMVLVDDDLPVVTPSGPFYDLNGTYIDGRQSYDLTVDATDAGAGIKRMDIDHLANPQLANKDAACDPTHYTPALGSRICPPEDQIDMVVETNPMPEGTRRFDAEAKDPAENIGHSPWTVIIDRTPPPAPNLRFLKPEEGSAQVEWDAAQDPILPDGTPGSQTTWYRYRSQINGGTWTNWHVIPASRQISNEVYDQPIDTEVRFEVQAIDLVRNISESSFSSDDVFGSKPTFSFSGSLWDKRGGYVDGATALELAMVASDAETGIRNASISHANHGVIADGTSICTEANQVFAPGKKICPRDLNVVGATNSMNLAEGHHAFFGNATDRVHNVGESERIDIYVDKSPPVDPYDLELDAHYGMVDFDWLSEDPDLLDGSDGSGISHYLVRLQIGDNDWTPYETVDAEAADFAKDLNIAEGTQLQAEVIAVDRVGHRSNAVVDDTEAGDDATEGNHSPDVTEEDTDLWANPEDDTISMVGSWSGDFAAERVLLTVNLEQKSDAGWSPIPGAIMTQTCRNVQTCELEGEVPYSSGTLRTSMTVTGEYEDGSHPIIEPIATSPATPFPVLGEESVDGDMNDEAGTTAVAAAACYGDWNTAYKFVNNVLPSCRVASHGVKDTKGGLSAYAFRHPQRDLLTLQENRTDSTYKIAWNILDSAGEKMFVLKRSKRGTWVFEDPSDGSRLGSVGSKITRGPKKGDRIERIRLQGYACPRFVYKTDRKKRLRRIMIGFQGGKDEFRTRGFIHPDAIPKSYRQVIAKGRADVRCHTRASGKGKNLKQSFPLGDAGYPRNAKFKGTDPEEGLRSYQTYNVRTLGSIVYINSTTTGIAGGGTVRGVVPDGTTFNVRSYFGYCDPNFAVNSDGMKMQWVYGYARYGGRSIWGFVPMAALGNHPNLLKCATPSGD